jgi:NADH:ubiquinone oxidoreductase subunit E
MATETEVIPEVLDQFEDQRSSLIPVLQEIQNKHRYLPQPLLRRVAEKLGVPLTDVYHVATFYNCFSLEPVGRNLVQVCLGTACHVRGAPKVLDRLLTDLKLPEPGTSADMEFTVRTVRCIGCCGLAPVVRVNSSTHPNMSQAKVKGMLKKYYGKQAAGSTAPSDAKSSSDGEHGEAR